MSYSPENIPRTRAPGRRAPWPRPEPPAAGSPRQAPGSPEAGVAPGIPSIEEAPLLGSEAGQGGGAAAGERVGKWLEAKKVVTILVP